MKTLLNPLAVHEDLLNPLAVHEDTAKPPSCA